jgi:hypothetical protein
LSTTIQTNQISSFRAEMCPKFEDEILSEKFSAEMETRKIDPWSRRTARRGGRRCRARRRPWRSCGCASAGTTPAGSGLGSFVACELRPVWIRKHGHQVGSISPPGVNVMISWIGQFLDKNSCFFLTANFKLDFGHKEQNFESKSPIFFGQFLGQYFKKSICTLITGHLIQVWMKKSILIYRIELKCMVWVIR